MLNFLKRKPRSAVWLIASANAVTIVNGNKPLTPDLARKLADELRSAADASDAIRLLPNVNFVQVPQP